MYKKILLFFFVCLIHTTEIFGQTQNQIDQYKGTTTGTNSYSVTINPATLPLYDAQKITVKYGATNTGAATLKLSNSSTTSAAASITLGGSALIAGDITSGVEYIMIYNLASTRWELQRPSGQPVVVSAGSNISVNSSANNYTVTNTAPNQTVTLTGAGTTTVSGTYPSYTVTGAPSGITVGTTAISSGTTGAVPFNDAGIYQEAASAFFWHKANSTLSIGSNTSGGKLRLTGALNSDLLVLTNPGGTSRLNMYVDAGESILHYNTGGLEQRFSITNTMRFRIGSSYNELISTLYLQGNSGSEALYISRPGGAGGRFGLYVNASEECILSGLNTDILFYTGSGGADERMRITSDGRIYGKAIHNNAGAVTGTTNQYIASGTYTFTPTNDANVAASTGYLSQWMRVGNVVTVSGKVDIDATLAVNTVTQVGIPLPIASNFTAEENCGGDAVSDVSVAGLPALSARVKADGTNDRAQISFNSLSLTNDSYSFQFTYIIK